MITRRHALALFGSVAAAALIATRLPALAQANPSPGELAQPGPLGDAVLGKPDAPVTVIEYASLTCSHCARFHVETYPELKKQYIDTGKVRFILREFPLDPLATAGFMLARCQGDAQYHAIADMLFERQKSWAFVDKPLDALQQMMRQAGMSQEKFESCLRDQKLYDGIVAVRDRAANTFKVNSTPTFFINGQRHAGFMTLAEMEKVIKPLLG
jgi:protein-disulfide isomerase